jgi:hypothetical protein
VSRLERAMDLRNPGHSNPNEAIAAR